MEVWLSLVASLSGFLFHFVPGSDTQTHRWHKKQAQTPTVREDVTLLVALTVCPFVPLLTLSLCLQRREVEAM